MEVECALLEGEQESEMTQLQREKELLDKLKKNMHSIAKTSHTEKSQVKYIKCSSHDRLLADIVCGHGFLDTKATAQARISSVQPQVPLTWVTFPFKLNKQIRRKCLQHQIKQVHHKLDLAKRHLPKTVQMCNREQRAENLQTK